MSVAFPTPEAAPEVSEDPGSVWPTVAAGLGWLGGALISGEALLLLGWGSQVAGSNLAVSNDLLWYPAFGLAFGLLVVALTAISYQRPRYRVGLGAGILLLALFSVVGGGGFDGAGLILASAGGILAISIDPDRTAENSPF
jgi:hypothetical protein